MRIAVKVLDDLRKAMEAEIAAGRKAMKGAMAEASEGLKQELRRQVVGAGLGTRLANTWRSAVYPKGRDSLGAAGLVFSKAPRIVSAFDQGTVIRARNGNWLAIPTEAAPRARPAARGSSKRPTPATVEAHFGRPLRFVYRAGRPALLVMDMLTASFRRKDGSLRGYRNLTGRRAATGRGAATVVMFVLVPSARMKKRLDVAAAGRRWQGNLPRLIVSNWERLSKADIVRMGGGR